MNLLSIHVKKYHLKYQRKITHAVSELFLSSLFVPEASTLVSYHPSPTLTREHTLPAASTKLTIRSSEFTNALSPHRKVYGSPVATLISLSHDSRSANFSND
jgi:hypothetical protein